MSTPKRDFTAKTARPVLDPNALYGMDEVPMQPAPVPAPAPNTVHEAKTAEEAGQEWVQFSTYLRRHTYLRLKQAEYWEPGVVARQQIEQVVSALLDTLE